MEAGFSPNAGMPAPTGSQDLIGTVSAISTSLMGEVSKVIIGKNENLRRVTVGILSNGNMLLEGFSWIGKNPTGKYLCSSLVVNLSVCNSHRTCCHLTSWVPTCMTKNQVNSNCEQVHLFSNILLADEINRAPPKTQAALL